MNLKTVIGAIALACVGVSSTPAFAQQAGAQQPQGWMWGFGVAASQDVYTDFDNRVVPILLSATPVKSYAFTDHLLAMNFFAKVALLLTLSLSRYLQVMKKMTVPYLQVWTTEILATRPELGLTTTRVAGFIHCQPMPIFLVSLMATKRPPVSGKGLE
ncbi:hypothetical protein BZA03_103109 [Alteromonas sp. I10]|nr:hypothetical protein BZA03_103109 [Alteromonas sp. I10]